MVLKSQIREVIKSSAWIYGFIAFALLASLVLDITGFARRELFPGAIFFLPTALAFVYCMTPAVLLRFAIFRRPFHWSLASLYVLIAYFGWFILMVALTGEPYSKPSYMVLLSLVAAWRLLHFSPKSEFSSQLPRTPQTTLHQQEPETIEDRVAVEKPEPRGSASSERDSVDQITAFMRSEGMMKAITFVAACTCTVTVALNAADWTNSQSPEEYLLLLVLFIIPCIAGSLCLLVGRIWITCAAFAVVSVMCIFSLILEPNNADSTTVFAFAMALVPVLAPLFRNGIPRSKDA